MKDVGGSQRGTGPFALGLHRNVASTPDSATSNTYVRGWTAKIHQGNETPTSTVRIDHTHNPHHPQRKKKVLRRPDTWPALQHETGAQEKANSNEAPSHECDSPHHHHHIPRGYNDGEYHTRQASWMQHSSAQHHAAPTIVCILSAQASPPCSLRRDASRYACPRFNASIEPLS